MCQEGQPIRLLDGHQPPCVLSFVALLWWWPHGGGPVVVAPWWWARAGVVHPGMIGLGEMLYGGLHRLQWCVNGWG